MGEIKLLDCTLRDGGYINDWKFGNNNLVSIFERIADAGTDIIEIGFLDEKRPFDPDRSIMPDTGCVGKIYGKLNKKQTMVVGMIDYGKCGLEYISPCNESFLDGIRVIFKKHLRKQAIAFCGELKKLGYKVFAQLVSVTSYSDEEMMDLIQLANQVRPYAVSMVDTYGLMHQNNLMHYFTLLSENLHSGIGLGYHAHNNFQMGYANCITMLSNETERMMIVDGSLYGMGKSAGNAPIELLAMHLNHIHGKRYRVSQLLEAIDSNISQFYHPATWGYNMFYYLAASNDCHPDYVSYLMNKHTLSVKSINELLGKLEGEKKLLYDKDYMEQLYVQYQLNEINDRKAQELLKKLFEGKELLLVGPGKSMELEHDKIESYVKERNLPIISINYIPDYLHPDYIFISNSKRYVQMATNLSQEKYKIIATSNVTCSSGEFDYVINIGPLLDRETELIDNSLAMLLRQLIRLQVKTVVLAGFDGYSCGEMNYLNEHMEYEFIKNKSDYLNRYMSTFLTENKSLINVRFLTKTKYKMEY